MALYIYTPDGSYPHSESSIRAANPQVSFSAAFRPPEGYETVFPAPAPSFDSITQMAREIAPVLTVKGFYEQSWEVVDLSEEAIAANRERAKQQLIQSVTQQTQQRLDDFAKTRNYDGVLSACTYATSPTAKFATEGQYCVEARDATWATLYTIMAEVEAGTRPMPSSFADIEPDLPVLEWPSI